MLIFEDTGLVYLAVPKTATQSIQKALRPFASPSPEKARNHMSLALFDRHLRPKLEAGTDRPLLTIAVVREPLARLKSWYHYRNRPETPAMAKSTQGIDFAQFVQAVLSPSPPAFARIGSQDSFVGWDGSRAGVDFVFDYAQLDLLAGFFIGVLGRPIRFPILNRAPASARASSDLLPAAAMAQMKTALRKEYDLYDKVAKLGCLMSDRAQDFNSSAH